MNLYRIIDKIKLRINASMQPMEAIVHNEPKVLIFCTLGMGELVCMSNLIESIPNVTLCIDRKKYIVEFVEYWFHVDYFFLDSVSEIADKFDVCIMPAGCMRPPEIKALVKLFIPVRIGQFKNNRFKFIFNYKTEVSNFINEETSFNKLLEYYENINSTILSVRESERVARLLRIDREIE
jgi:hypothetical protein